MQRTHSDQEVVVPVLNKEAVVARDDYMKRIARYIRYICLSPKQDSVILGGVTLCLCKAIMSS